MVHGNRFPLGFLQCTVDHPNSMHLLAFTYNRVVAEVLVSVDFSNMLIQFVDDLLTCSLTREQFRKYSLKVLRMLAENGHKVSRKKKVL